MTDSGTRRPVVDASPGARHRLTALRAFLPEIALLVVAAVLWLQTSWFRAGPPEDLGPAFWPRLLIGLLAVCTLARVAQKARALRPGGTDTDTGTDDSGNGEEEAPDSRRAALAILSIVGYVAAAIYLGYLIATAAFVVGFLVLSGKRRTVLNTVLGVGAALAFSFLFLKVVYVSVPSGVGVFDSITVGVYDLIGIF